MLKSSLSLSGLTDPEEASLAKSASFVDALDRQIKLHLLLTEHLVLSNGFVFDNPGIWYLLYRSPELAQALSSKFNGSSLSAGIILTDKTENFDINEQFRSWFLRPSGPTKLSSLNVSWHQISSPSLDINDLYNIGDRLTIGTFAESLGFDHLKLAISPLETIFNSWSQLSKNEQRHSEFLEIIRAHFKQRDSIMLSDSHVDRDEYIRFKDYIADDALTSISRTKLTQIFPSVWSNYKNVFNTIRRSVSLSDKVDSQDRSKLLTLTPPQPVDLPNTLTNELSNVEFSKSSPNNYLLLDKLSYDDIIKIRSQTSFQTQIRNLASLTYAEFSSTDYKDAIDSWGNTLIDIASSLELNHCVRHADKSYKTKWAHHVGNAFTEVFSKLAGTGIAAKTGSSSAGAVAEKIISEAAKGVTSHLSYVNSEGNADTASLLVTHLRDNVNDWIWHPK